MSIHSCNLHCHTIDPEKLDLMGLEDTGKWMPFTFHMDIVIACKLTSEDQETLHNCTTIFTEHGDAYIIDTPYTEFSALFTSYHIGPTTATPTELNF
jgi:hypothetical protein